VVIKAALDANKKKQEEAKEALAAVEKEELRSQVTEESAEGGKKLEAHTTPGQLAAEPSKEIIEEPVRKNSIKRQGQAPPPPKLTIGIEPETTKVRVVTRVKPPGTPTNGGKHHKSPNTPTAKTGSPLKPPLGTLSVAHMVKSPSSPRHGESLSLDLSQHIDESWAACEKRLREQDESLQTGRPAEESKLQAKISDMSEEARRRQDVMIDIALRRIQSQTAKLARIETLLVSDSETSRQLALAELDKMQQQLDQEDQTLRELELDQEKLRNQFSKIVRPEVPEPERGRHGRAHSSGSRQRAVSPPAYGSFKKGDFPVAPPLPPFANVTPSQSQSNSELSVSSLSSTRTRSHSLQLAPDIYGLFLFVVVVFSLLILLYSTIYHGQ